MYSYNNVPWHSHQTCKVNFASFLFLVSFISKYISTPKSNDCTRNQWDRCAIEGLVTQKKGNRFVCIIHISFMNAYSMTTASVGLCQDTKQQVVCIQIWLPIKAVNQASNHNPRRKDGSCLLHNILQSVDNSAFQYFLTKSVNGSNFLMKANGK